MSTELVRLESDLDAGANELGDVAAQVRSLVEDQNAGLLDEVRCRADAMRLYEKRAHNIERENHFWTMKCLAEAGLGSLSFDSPEVVPAQTERANFRVLASAFERGKLLDICAQRTEDHRGGSFELVNAIRRQGYTQVPGSLFGQEGSIPYSRARRMAIERGVPLSDLPIDQAYVSQRQQQWAETSWRMRRRHRAAERLERMKERKSLSADADEHSPEFGKAYALLRRTMQAMYDAQQGMTKRERNALDDIFYHLHRAEDHIGVLIRGGES